MISKNMTKNRPPNKAFSLIELSIVLLIIGIIIAGVTQSSSLLKKAKLLFACASVQSSPVSGIEGLILWLETTCDKSFAGTLPDNGSEVNTWYDINPQSSNHSDVTIHNQDHPVLFTYDCINGLPCLKSTPFSSSYFKSSTNISPSVSPELTIFMVLKIQTMQNNTNYFAGFGGSSVNNRGMRVGDLFYVHSGNSLDQTFSAVPTTQSPTLISISYKSNISNGSNFFLNGGPASTPFTDSTVDDISQFSGLHENIKIGFLSDYGYTAEFIAYNRALKDDERKSVEKYLAKKWGITITSSPATYEGEM
jgi:prepilin-type N-terminal cleavage/methylation domain-containing protein